MSYIEIAVAVLFMPVSALLIAWWVLAESKKITAQAHARAAREREAREAAE